MSTTYGEYWAATTKPAMIVFTGQLVEIRRNCFEHLPVYGIIIECMHPHFGIGYDDDFWVLINGQIERLKNYQIHPVGDYCE